VEPSTVRVGEVLAGRFRIEERLGAGGMGTVFRAVDKKYRRPVAVKLYDVQNALDIKRAYQEVQVLARLRHPAIVSHIADGVTDSGHLYLVMEWIEGVTAFDRLEQGQFTISEVVALGLRIAEALAAAHAAGVVHRDVKPGNVLLPDNRAEGATLIDFGIARVATAEHRLTQSGLTVGTPGYMAPEQCTGEGVVTPASDVFSLGCVLYECLTNHPPFVGSSPVATLAKIVFSDAEPIHTYRPDAPTMLVDLIGNMMKREVGNRMPDAKTVAARLYSIDLDLMAATSPAAVNPSPPPRTHSMVFALSITEEPPSTEQVAAVRALASRFDARAELLEPNQLCVHVEGERETVQRAAAVAVEMRRILSGWMIGVSSEQSDAASAAERGTQLLSRAAMAAVFGKIPRDAIVADTGTQVVLSPTFDVADHGDYETLEIRGLKTNR
jgi:serine/threonine protein kinase